MTRKDYQRIARALILAKEHETRNNRMWAAPAMLTAAEFIANELEDDNPRFDRAHFLAVVEGDRKLDSSPPRS